MELGQYTLQIFVGLAVILCAAFVALICDFLKRNNEQLRELTIELKVRREEEQRRSQMMIAQPVSAPVPALSERTVTERVANARLENARIEERMNVPVARALATQPPAGKASPLESSRFSEKEKIGKEKIGVDKKRAPSAEALAAMERGAQLAASPRRRPMPPRCEPEIATPSATAQHAAPQSARVITPRVEVIDHAVARLEGKPSGVAAPAKATSVTTTAGKLDWGSLLARKPTMPGHMEQHQPPRVEVREDLLDAVFAVSNSAQPAASAVVPAGFHEGYILSRLVQSRQPVSGLVVSIGVNTPRNQDGSMPQSIRQLMQSLIGPGDFACQSSGEEFLLIYPNEHGASAQRRLSEIAEQLWDFQLRSLGSFSILFSWGGIEVRSESIDEAIASANERMHETRRGRKLLTMEARPEQQHQQAFRQAV